MGSHIRKDITIEMEPGKGIEEWTLQESLAFSQQQQKDFIIEIDENHRPYVVFGDGEFGAIPPRGTTIRATYRVGGGTYGNVLAHTIDTIADAPQLALLPGVKVTNQYAATGGAEGESIEHAVKHAPMVFRSRKRAVTRNDYKALALNFKGVGKVRAEKANWNTVILYVAPEGGGKVSDVLRKNLLAYFEDKRPISTIVEIEDVDYIKIYVTAEIGIESYYSWEHVKEKVQAAGKNLLDFQYVDFACTLYLSKFYEAIEAVDGVAYVTITEFGPGDAPPGDGFISESGKIILEENEIPVIPCDPGDEDYAGGIKLINAGEA
jgi:predicted phage baseplate assembly protein